MTSLESDPPATADSGGPSDSGDPSDASEGARPDPAPGARPAQPATTLPTTLPTTPRKREAEEWALVLSAEGFHPVVVRHDRVFTLQVEPNAMSAAGAILDAWRLERYERAHRIALPPPRSATPLETATAYALALSLLAFYLGLEASNHADAFRNIGASRAALVLDGQAWRLITALSLHADLPHVLGNTLFGGFFLAAVANRLGIGFALLAFVTSGTLGNLANALYYGSAHSSIGASTGVFGLVGVLAGLAAWQRHRTAPPGRGAWVAFAAGLGIVAMLGSGGPGIDFSAHLFGLAAGGATGLLIAAPFAMRPCPGRRAQLGAAAIACTIVLGAWSLAHPWTFSLGPA
jgi:membrane associated rhomboid family serine protease